MRAHPVKALNLIQDSTRHRWHEGTAIKTAAAPLGNLQPSAKRWVRLLWAGRSKGLDRATATAVSASLRLAGTPIHRRIAAVASRLTPELPSKPGSAPPMAVSSGVRLFFKASWAPRSARYRSRPA